MQSFRHAPAAVGMGPARAGLHFTQKASVDNHIGLARRECNDGILSSVLSIISRVPVYFFPSYAKECGSLAIRFFVL
jgi:hypothetical protein